MRFIPTNYSAGGWPRVLTAMLLVCLLAPLAGVRAQDAPAVVKDGPPAGSAERSPFRVEKLTVAVGAELITVFARGDGQPDKMGPVADVPLISVVRDTLGDRSPENDRLRYVWLLSYTRPSLTQKLSAFVPFLYTRTTNKKDVGSEPPPAVIDVQSSDKALWNKAFWMILRRLIVSEAGMGPRVSALQYGQNVSDYRRSAVASALALLSVYQDVGGESVLSDRELSDIQARLSLTDKFFGWHMQSENLGRVFDAEQTKTRDDRAHNWELLRQYSERDGLYFEPLKMPDGSARHAIVWTTEEDLRSSQNRKWDGRFLNIKDPWKDEKLKQWTGYTAERWFDSDDREVPAGTPNATCRKMIPLAIYGLDHPKIPVLLVDFRDNSNPKLREISQRIVTDVLSNLLAVSRFSSLPLLVGKFVYDFVTHRRGMDINQSSRVRSYSQLKLLLSLDDALEPELKGEVEKRVEYATLDPLQNDIAAESRLARKQYENLVAYARDPNGLSRKIAEDRREEMTRIKHGVTGRSLFALAHVFSLGLYTHREDDTPEMRAQLDMRRQLDYHERYLREVARTSAGPEVDQDVTRLNASLLFVAEHGSAAAKKTASALAKIFKLSDDENTRALCITGLYKINNSSAKNELLAIYKMPRTEDKWKELCAHYLTLALHERQRMTAQDAQAVAVLSREIAN